MNSFRSVDENGIIRYKNIHDELHREDGPAVEYTDGYKEWYINGKRHREDGPAVEYPDGTKLHYLNGIHYYNEDYETEVLNRRLKRIKDL